MLGCVGEDAENAKNDGVNQRGGKLLRQQLIAQTTLSRVCACTPVNLHSSGTSGGRGLRFFNPVKRTFTSFLVSRIHWIDKHFLCNFFYMTFTKLRKLYLKKSSENHERWDWRRSPTILETRKRCTEDVGNNQFDVARRDTDSFSITFGIVKNAQCNVTISDISRFGWRYGHPFMWIVIE